MWVCVRARQSSLWRGREKKIKGENISPARIKKQKKKFKSHTNAIAAAAAAASESEKKMSSIFITVIIFTRDAVSLKFTDV